MFDSVWMDILWLAPCLASVLIAKGLVHLFQLASYQFQGYFASLKRRLRQEMMPGLILASVSFGITAVADSLARGGQPLYLALGALLILLAGLLLGYLMHRKKVSVRPLQLTARIKRLYLWLALVMLLIGLMLKRLLPVLGLSAMLPLLLPLFLALAALLAWPLEHGVKKLYQHDAKRLLLGQKGLIRVGITGSYGKTSVKFFLESLLKQRYSALATRLSFNTPMGITRSIREDLQPSHRVFIAEMGARHRRDIRELCDFVKPQIGILTAVAPQHLETLGSLERVRDTKYDLIAALPDDGYAIFYNDEGIVRGLWEKTQIDKAIVGSPGDDLWAEDIRLGYEGSSFTLCMKDGTRLPCRMELSGEHNIRNVLLATAAARYLGLTDAQLQRGISLLQPVQARLEAIKQPDGSVVINNGFNANPESSRASLELLLTYSGRKIVVTPGFAELGGLEKGYHRELGQRIAKAAGLVALVGPKRTEPIRQGLLAEGFPADNIHVFMSLKDANAWLSGIRRAGDIILYENDLPDQYSEA